MSTCKTFEKEMQLPLFTGGWGGWKHDEDQTRPEEEEDKKNESPSTKSQKEKPVKCSTHQPHGHFVQFPSVEPISAPLVAPENIFKNAP